MRKQHTCGLQVDLWGNSGVGWGEVDVKNEAAALVGRVFWTCSAPALQHTMMRMYQQEYIVLCAVDATLLWLISVQLK